MYFIIAVFILFAGMRYRWGSEGRSEMINYILGQGKVALSGIYVYYLAVAGVKPFSVLMLIFVLIITLFEYSRTTVVAMTLGTLVLAYYDKTISTKKLFVLSIGFFCLFTYIAIYRIGFGRDSFDLFNYTYPLFFEGSYGSYMNLQVYELILKGKCIYTFFLSYLVDPIVFMIPRALLAFLSFDKDSLSVFVNWMVYANNSMLQDSFPPYGGFFYIAEASVAMPFVGPAIIAFAYGCLSGIIESRKGDNIFSRLNFIIFSIGFNMVFIKHRFAAAANYYFTTMISAYSIVVCYTIIKACTTNYSHTLAGTTEHETKLPMSG
jgi:hypothetical protein